MVAAKGLAAERKCRERRWVPLAAAGMIFRETGAVTLREGAASQRVKIG
jgi:hypothetical protein